MDKIKKFCVINSFTYNGQGGNAAAVFINKGKLNDYIMQNIARQLNLVETVYINKSEEQEIYAQEKELKMQHVELETQH